MRLCCETWMHVRQFRILNWSRNELESMIPAVTAVYSLCTACSSASLTAAQFVSHLPIICQQMQAGPQQHFHTCRCAGPDAATAFSEAAQCFAAARGKARQHAQLHPQVHPLSLFHTDFIW